MSNILKGVHFTLNARTEEDVDEDIIIEKVSKSSASAYSFEGRLDLSKDGFQKMVINGKPTIGVSVCYFSINTFFCNLPRILRIKKLNPKTKSILLNAIDFGHWKKRKKNKGKWKRQGRREMNCLDLKKNV